MKPRRLALLLPVLLSGLLAVSPSAARAAEYVVTIDRMRFGPVPAQIRAGDTILWVNRDAVAHTATERDGSFNVALPPRSRGRTVVGHAGMVGFFCAYHPGMIGSLTVIR